MAVCAPLISVVPARRKTPFLKLPAIAPPLYASLVVSVKSPAMSRKLPELVDAPTVSLEKSSVTQTSITVSQEKGAVQAPDWFNISDFDTQE